MQSVAYLMGSFPYLTIDWCTCFDVVKDPAWFTLTALWGTMPHFFLWWRHQMETFSALRALCAGNSPGTRSPVNSPLKGQWRGALMFSLICVWINGWVNTRKADDLRRYYTHYDVTVMPRRRLVGMAFGDQARHDYLSDRKEWISMKYYHWNCRLRFSCRLNSADD